MDQPEFDDFFRTHFLRLVLFLIKIGASRAEAEDAAQETMCRAYRLWSSIDNPRAWVRVVAERVYLSSSVRAKEERDNALAHESGAERHAGTDLRLPREEARDVFAVLTQLPYWQRKVMAWHHDGFTIREIAECTGKPEVTIRAHLRHARDRLRLIIVGPGHGETPSGGGAR